MDTTKSRSGCIRSIHRKPVGGFCFVRARGMLAAWFAMMEEMISLYDLRVWLACHELKARRCQTGEGRKPVYRPDEVLGLVEAGSRTNVERSIERLQRVGLLVWNPGSVSPLTASFEEGMAGRPDWQAFVEAVTNNRRKVPVPRRMICHLAGSRNRTLIATVFGHLLRCLYYRKGRCVSGGRCKASWISEVFGVDVRNVKAARKTLTESGWLVPGEASQTCLNRWGLPVIINLSWGAGAHGDEESPPRKEDSASKSPPPNINKELSSRSMNQKLTRRAGGEKEVKKAGSPTLKRIAPEDLTEPIRLDRLYEEAAGCGIVPRSCASRLQWFAAAEHALAAGDRNPCGLFAAMYRRGLWQHITQAQEDLARVKLKKLDFGEESWLPGQGRGYVPDYEEIAA